MFYTLVIQFNVEKEKERAIPFFPPILNFMTPEFGHILWRDGRPKNHLVLSGLSPLSGLQVRERLKGCGQWEWKELDRNPLTKGKSPVCPTTIRNSQTRIRNSSLGERG